MSAPQMQLEIVHLRGESFFTCEDAVGGEVSLEELENLLLLPLVIPA